MTKRDKDNKESQLKLKELKKKNPDFERLYEIREKKELEMSLEQQRAISAEKIKAYQDDSGYNFRFDP